MKGVAFWVATALGAVAYWFIAPAIASLAPVEILGECYRSLDPARCAYESLAVKTAAFVVLGTFYAHYLWLAYRVSKRLGL